MKSFQIAYIKKKIATAPLYVFTMQLGAIILLVVLILLFIILMGGWYLWEKYLSSRKQIHDAAKWEKKKRQLEKRATTAAKKEKKIQEKEDFKIAQQLQMVVRDEILAQEIFDEEIAKQLAELA